MKLSYDWFNNFPNQFIWCSVWIWIACFLYHMFSLFCCAVDWIRKDVPTKTWKYLFRINKFKNDSEFFWTERNCSADCVAGPARRDRVHKFCVTIKEGLVVRNKTNQSFSFMSPPGLTALGLTRLILSPPTHHQGCQARRRHKWKWSIGFITDD